MQAEESCWETAQPCLPLHISLHGPTGQKTKVLPLDQQQQPPRTPAAPVSAHPGARRRLIPGRVRWDGRHAPPR